MKNEATKSNEKKMNRLNTLYTIGILVFTGISLHDAIGMVTMNSRFNPTPVCILCVLCCIYSVMNKKKKAEASN